MKNLLYIFTISLHIGLVLPQESWNTSIVDYSWNKSFKRLIYRQPIIFSPFEIKGGYFHYGGADYLSGFPPILGRDLSEHQHPVLLDATQSEYNGLNNLKDRNGVFMEIDILKTNLLVYLIPQNIIDVQFGLGYRISHMLSRPYLPDDIAYTNPHEYWREYRFFPKMQDFNFNTTISWQFNQSIIPYLYHSIGFTKISLYKTEGDQTYLSGRAISETFSMGIKKLISDTNRSTSHSLYYGAELKLLNTTTYGDLDDPYNFSPITGFDMKGINFNLIFGVLLGAKRTTGDEAFSLLLENKYEEAIPIFEEYIDTHQKKNILYGETLYGRKKKANKMLSFARAQVPRKRFKQGLDKLSNGDLDNAVRFFNDAYINADDNLRFEINFKKEEIAKTILNDVASNFDRYSIKESEDLLNKALSVSIVVREDVQKSKGKLFFKKASLLHDSNLLFDAIKYYNLSIAYDPDLSKLVGIRMESLVNALINNSNRHRLDNEISLMLESLNKAIELDEKLSYKLSPIIKEFELLKEQSSQIRTQRMIDQIIEENKSKHAEKEIELIIGMTKDRVANYLDMPNDIEFIKSSLDSYEIWFYIDLNQKLFFKDEKLYQIRKIEE